MNRKRFDFYRVAILSLAHIFLSVAIFAVFQFHPMHKSHDLFDAWHTQSLEYNKNAPYNASLFTPIPPKSFETMREAQNYFGELAFTVIQTKHIVIFVLICVEIFFFLLSYLIVHRYEDTYSPFYASTFVFPSSLGYFSILVLALLIYSLVVNRAALFESVCYSWGMQSFWALFFWISLFFTTGSKATTKPVRLR